LAHPVIEIAATACGPPSRTGAATHAIPTVDSSCSSAPRAPGSGQLLGQQPGATTVRVAAASPPATTAASRSGGAKANIALPTPVQYAGIARHPDEESRPVPPRQLLP
jgi:hypothetical protein